MTQTESVEAGISPSATVPANVGSQRTGLPRPSPRCTAPDMTTTSSPAVQPGLERLIADSYTISGGGKGIRTGNRELGHLLAGDSSRCGPTGMIPNTPRKPQTPPLQAPFVGISKTECHPACVNDTTNAGLFPPAGESPEGDASLDQLLANAGLGQSLDEVKLKNLSEMIEDVVEEKDESSFGGLVHSTIINSFPDDLMLPHLPSELRRSPRPIEEEYIERTSAPSPMEPSATPMEDGPLGSSSFNEQSLKDALTSINQAPVAAADPSGPLSPIIPNLSMSQYSVEEDPVKKLSPEDYVSTTPIAAGFKRNKFESVCLVDGQNFVSEINREEESTKKIHWFKRRFVCCK